MQQWQEIRHRVLKQGVSKRQILRETGMHWQTLEKILEHSSPPGYYRQKPARKPMIGPWLGRIVAMLKEDQAKQYHTAKRIWQRLQQEGFTGGYTIVKDAVREIKKHNKEIFMPLSHRPGEAQVDFGYALVKMAGVLRKIAFLVMTLPYSDGFFVMAFDHECTETFWEGHVRAFEFFGGVPQRITYDNSKVMVSQIIGSRKRSLTTGFLQLVSHYLLERKPYSLDHARPFENWSLPECFQILRDRLEAQQEEGTREYIRILCLLEKYTIIQLATAIENALQLRVHSADGIIQFADPLASWGQSTFSLDGREHLRYVTAAACDVGIYSNLLTGGGMV